MKVKSVILAAGEGKRMNSDIPKVLHKVNDKMMINYVLDVVRKIDIDDVYLVVGNQSELVKEKVKYPVTFVEQKERLGTAHAVMQVKKYINDDDVIIVLYGDTPLITSSTISKIIKKNKDNNEGITILTAILDNPYGYGRIIRKNNSVVKIVEELDATDLERKVKEINSGVMCIKGDVINRFINNIKNDNKKGEYYLTDLVKLAINNDIEVGGMILENSNEILGVNTQEQLHKVEEVMKGMNI